MRAASIRTAPIRSPWMRFASRRLAAIRSAPRRFTFLRFASLSAALLRSVSLSVALLRFAPVRFAPRSFAMRRSAPLKFARTKLAPRRSACVRSGLVSGFCSLHRFQTSTPFLRVSRCSSFAVGPNSYHSARSMSWARTAIYNACPALRSSLNNHSRVFPPWRGSSGTFGSSRHRRSGSSLRASSTTHDPAR